MVSIKEATKNAIAFARGALGRKRTEGMRLEEVESTTVDGEDAWLITLSLIVPPGQTGGVTEALAAFGGGPDKREYKSFTVIKRDGEITSMKIREMAGAPDA